MKIKFWRVVFIAVCFLASFQLRSQNCLSTLNGTVVDMGCNQACSTLVFQISHLKSSSDYTLNSIPYNPYPFTTPTGNELTLLYSDDEWSNVIHIPFGFCFYDSVFSAFTVGSNGLMTFDTSNRAPCDNGYLINTSTALPGSGGGSPCTRGGPWYPRSSIMGNFSDLDPSTSASPFSKKIEWRVEGTAPCRRAIVSFNTVGIFGSSCGANFPNTFQMVIYETTGVVDIYTAQKSLCTSSTSSGRAIMGIQNWNWTKAVPVPNRNPGQWTASNEAYRFTPSGGASRFISSQILDINGTPLVNADTLTTVPGMLDLSFPNFCPAPGNGQYIIKTTFNSCTNPTTQLTTLDTFTINRVNSISATTSTTGTTCGGANDGTIIVNPTGTGPFLIGLDGAAPGTYLGSHTFTGLAPGPHVITVANGTNCTITLNVTIAAGPTLTTTATKTDALCNGASTGSITVTPPSIGTPPYRYSLDSLTWQSSNIFNNLPAGTYTVYFQSSDICPGKTTITIGEPSALLVTASTTNGTCNGGTDGTITISANGGSPGYQYSINGTTWQASNLFNVVPGPYTVSVKDNNGCINSFPVTVNLTNDLTFSPQADATICEGSSTQLSLTSNALQYTWTPSTGLSNTSIYNPVANPVTTTQYKVRAQLGVCYIDDTVMVNVNAAPIPNAGADGFICYGQTYQLNAAGGTVYSWTPVTFLNDATIANPISSPTKDITYTLSVISDINGCPSLTTDQIRIDVTPPIKVKTFPYDTVAHSGDMIQILAVPSDSDVINYVWSPATGLSDTKIPNPIATAGAVGDVVIYKVVTSTIAGCKGEGFVTIRVYKGPDIYVPTGFTPNGDGKNDKFTPFPVGMKSYRYFRVFNRWGQLVFSSPVLHDGWDGKLGGRDQPSGTYVWMIEGITKDDKVITKKGTVTLIR